MIKLTWDDLLVREAPADPAAIYSDWQWLLSGRFRPIAWSWFGDSFLERDDGTVQFLNVREGALDTIAESEDQFYELINQRGHQEDWLLSLLIWKLHHVPLVPSRGQCYGFKIHPILGGQVEPDNVVIMDFLVWTTISGQLWRQARG